MQFGGGGYSIHPFIIFTCSQFLHPRARTTHAVLVITEKSTKSDDETRVKMWDFRYDSALRFERACAKACLRLWLRDSLFAYIGMDVGMRKRDTARGFRSECQCLFAARWFLPHCVLVKRIPGAEPPYWSFHLSCSLPHCVFPFLPSQSIPLCVHLCPLTNHSGQMLFCTAVSQTEGDFVFSSFDTCIACRHTHCSQSVQI